ncbi:hypothetical protein [uncultured Winogradskyella sp.]|uniref:hypothetical protein n=1 Tax=uncultured Winogradskyella sp. TaxID=395353 RepID=UPI00262D5C7C|nr:hypothetical protein [uncultured Winogradskyella sp.]
MKKIGDLNLKKLKVFFCFSLFATFFSCPSDDCTKTISIPQVYFVGNQSYTSYITQEVPCNFPEPSDPDVIGIPFLENFTYQILSFNYIAQTSNNTTILQFEIQLNNNNDFDVFGVPYITTTTGDIQVSTANYANDASNSCSEISANSSCIFSFDQEYVIESSPPSETFEIINVEYIEID